ncbi:MAG: hypothetical protein JO151_18380 [Verrucomicrobia bacterium]|nr:hypothetical protein [Verrucomicrobiota bacterium]
MIIDDSVSSGNSIAEAIKAIENEGGEVEGAIALVQFPHRGGIDWANAAGYRAEAILDIWSDLGMARTLAKPEQRLAAPAGKVRAPEGLHPAALARFSAATWLATGLAPRPPLQMDCQYECPGGVFVSFRERANDNRIARSGFWHFNPDNAAPCADVIEATIETLRDANGRITAQTLPELKIAVTFLSALEQIKPRELDFQRYGIVTRSRTFPSKMGGALPNTQVFISEVEQYRQARVTNARIVPGEPHDLFRHEVLKYVEPGQTWLPYGSPESTAAWWRTAACGRWITARARQLFDELQGKSRQSEDRESAGRSASVDALRSPLVPEEIGPIEAVAVRVYQPNSGLIGYGLALGTEFDVALRAAVLQAATDSRGSGLTVATIVVSVLHNPELLGRAAVETVAFKLRRGLDALAIDYSGKTTILLPTVLVYNNLTRAEFVRTCSRLAGAEAAIEGRQVEWRTLQCVEWLDDGRSTRPLRFGFAVRDANTLVYASLIRLLGTYILESLGADGLPRYMLEPASGEVQIYGTAARAIHGLMSLDHAGLFLGERSWQDAAGTGLVFCLNHVRNGTVALPDGVGGALADAVLLGAVARSEALRQRAASRALAARLRSLLRPEGRIGYTPKRLETPEDHEFLPGALLAGLADFGAIQDASAQVEWYAHHFSALPSWGQAGWLPQGMAALYRVTGDRSAVELAFAATDWAIDQQVRTSGAFLEDLSPDEPSFNTGFIAEGVAASWEIAIAVGDVERTARYAAAWSEAMRFMTNLIVFPEDVFALRAGTKAIGGVRCTLTRSDIRIDQVSHCLHSLVTGAYLQCSGSRLNTDCVGKGEFRSNQPDAF